MQLDMMSTGTHTRLQNDLLVCQSIIKNCWNRLNNLVNIINSKHIKFGKQRISKRDDKINSYRGCELVELFVLLKVLNIKELIRFIW